MNLLHDWGQPDPIAQPTLWECRRGCLCQHGPNRGLPPNAYCPNPVEAMAADLRAIGVACGAQDGESPLQAVLWVVQQLVDQEALRVSMKAFMLALAQQKENLATLKRVTEENEALFSPRKPKA